MQGGSFALLLPWGMGLWLLGYRFEALGFVRDGTKSTDMEMPIVRNI